MTCTATCVNTTTSTASRIAFYSFDSVTTDATGNYPLTGISSPNYVSGWIGSAISFNASNAQRLNTSTMPISFQSFSIEFWFYALNVSSGWDIPFMGQCTAHVQDKCLFLSIWYNRLAFGFFADDTVGTLNLSPNNWYHAAFVFDNSTRKRCIYLNGILDNQGTAVNTLQVTSASFTIGGARIGGRVLTLNSYYTGYIDHVTISGREKSACEIYLDANLACYLTFDSIMPITDSGPNFLVATNVGTLKSTIGRVNQALQFSSSLSYITIHHITPLQSNFNTFSISMWISATNINGGGTIIHTSTQSNS